MRVHPVQFMHKIRSIIWGSSGQDGRLLSRHLEEQGHEILAVGNPARAPEDPTGWDITDADDVVGMITEWRPDEVYHLAAYHQSSEDQTKDNRETWERGLAVNFRSLGYLLYAVRDHQPHCRVFYAGSCQILTEGQGPGVDENLPMLGRNSYGIMKTAAVQQCRLMRSNHGVHVCVGILYNHESIFRPSSFLSRKIVTGVIAIRRGRAENVKLGDLSARADWCHASEVVRAMRLILRVPNPSDYMICSGNVHTVEDFAREAFAAVGLDWRDHVVQEPGLVAAARRPFVPGSPGKLKAATGWESTLTLSELVRCLIREEGAGDLLN